MEDLRDLKPVKESDFQNSGTKLALMAKSTLALDGIPKTRALVLQGEYPLPT